MQKYLCTVILAVSLIHSAAAQPATPAASVPAGIRPAAEPVVAVTSNEQTLARFYAAVNEGRLADAGAFLAEDFICAAPLPGMKPGRDGYRHFLAQFRTGFPDARFEPVEFVSQGETTVCRYRFTGTHRVKFLNLRPTHKAADVSGIAVWRFREGKMIELQGNFDALGLLVQLGLVPPLKEADAGSAKPNVPGRPENTSR